MTKFTVGMDISQLSHKGGVAIYTDNLSSNLSNIEDIDMVYFYSSLRNSYSGNLQNVRTYRFPPSVFEPLFNDIRKVPIEKFIGKVDVFHSSDWIQPPSKSKKVTTFHDLIPIKYPQWSNPKIVKVHKKRLKLVEKEIDFVIAVSESTKKDLVENSKIPPEKIKVIYEAPTFDFIVQSEQKVNDFKRKYKLPEKFILAIGGIGERKNLNRIKEACKDYNLVISGESLPYLSIEELGLLYQSASVLLYASIYEGFGLPILDAFLLGLPVITSNTSSMPEVGSDAAMYVDPLNIDDMKIKLKTLLNDKDLRKEFIKKGSLRVKEFSWKKVASETVAVYKMAAKS